MVDVLLQEIDSVLQSVEGIEAVVGFLLNEFVTNSN